MTRVVDRKSSLACENIGLIVPLGEDRAPAA